jgi:HD-GYP domain-containing protein (c-di-GMP phosphodiesterase class II)
VLIASTLPPAALVFWTRDRMFMPPLSVHFYGVGVSALVATVAAVVLTTAGVRARDGRTVVVGGGFTVMAALLAVHGLVTPGVVVGPNGVIALTGAATLPVGAAVLALSGVRALVDARSIPKVIALSAAVAVATVVVSVVGVLEPSLVPSVPAAGSPAAKLLLVIGAVLFVSLGARAANTFLLTHRIADLSVVFGLALLGVALYAALMLSFTYLGWWIGHAFELAGIAVIGASTAYDLRRGRGSRTLSGALRAGDIVQAEEAFLGARVRALMLRLAEKDVSTEEHTRRVAALAVDVGERLGLSASRLRVLATGALLHDIGKLSIADSILRKPGPLDDDEYAEIKLHPERGRDLLTELGGFDDDVKRLVLSHHERLDGSGYPYGLRAPDLDLETRILAVCDVYDALVSSRVYRAAWSQSEAIELLGRESGVDFDQKCVAALVAVVGARTLAVAV